MAITNKKVFKEAVQEYVKSILSTDQFEELAFQLNETAEEFKSWYQGYELKRNPNKYAAFQEWMMGLPSSFNIDYWNNEMCRIYDSWFESIGEPLKPIKEDRKIELFKYYVVREFETLCKKNGVQF